MSEAPEIELLHASMMRVWNERDDAKRLAAIDELYHPHATIFEPAQIVSGHQAISDIVAGVLADTPPGFTFAVTGVGHGHHGIANSQWKGGPPGEVIVSGAGAHRRGKNHRALFPLRSEAVNPWGRTTT